MQALFNPCLLVPYLNYEIMNILTEKIDQKPSVSFVANRTKSSAQNAFNQIKSIHEQLRNQLNQNHYYTTAEILAELGEESQQVLLVHKEIKDLLNGFVPHCADCDA